MACAILLVFSCLAVISATDIDSSNDYATDTDTISTGTAHETNNIQSSSNKNSYNSGLDTSNSVTTDIDYNDTSQASKTISHTNTTASMNDTPKTEKSITKSVTSNLKGATANPNTWSEFTNAITRCTDSNLVITLNEGATYIITTDYTISNTKVKNVTIIGNGATFNGKTLKDKDGNIIKVKVVNSKASYSHYIPAGTACVDNDGVVRKYVVTAVYHNDYFISDTQNTTKYTVERSPIIIKINNATVKGTKLSVKGSITDYQNNKVVGINKVCVKINSETYVIDGKTQYYNIKNGTININNIKVKNTVKSVQVVSGDRQAYLSGRGNTTKITTL